MSTLWLLTAICLVSLSCGTPFLLFANRKDIRLIDVSKPRSNSTVVIGHLEDATALDFSYEDAAVFWADISLEMIKRTAIDGTGPATDVISTGLTSPEGLACDWLGKKLYWTDAETNRIEVSNFDGGYRKVLFWEDLDQPRAIALAPMDGLMFWTDWGEVPKIERAAMDGNHSSRDVIVSKDVSWPNGVTVDYQAKRIYWADGKLHLISSTDYNGENRRLVVDGSGLEHPFALTIYKNIIYWTDWQTRSIQTCNQTGGGRKTLLNGQLSPMGIHAYVPERQPKKKTPCQKDNGGCSHLCLLSPYEPGYSCACPTGVKLKDKFRCFSGAQEMLLLARRTDLRRISLDTPDYTDVVLQVAGVKHAIAIDYDPVDGHVYWSDDEVRRIRRSRLDGSGQEDLIVTEVYHPDGIAVDWIARNLYWTDTGTDRIEVARLNGTSRKVLINQGLEEPRAIVLDPVSGYLFWTDWGEAPKIERANLDGTERMVIVDSDLGWPNGLALDYEELKVYWGDAKTDKIELCNMNGTDRRQLVTDKLPHIFGFSLLGDYIYWTDWQRRSIERVHKETGDHREIIIEQLPDLMGLKAIKVNKHWGTNPCASNNGGCSHLCLNRPGNAYLCSCPMGMELAVNQRVCIVPEAFLLFARRCDIRRISLETHHNNVIIPVSGIRDAIALDFDNGDSRIYWADTGHKTICRAFMNGSNFENVIDFGLVYPEDLAVDWVAHNIYWTDMGSQRIEVSRLDGTSRKVLVWKEVTSPHAITLDPSDGFFYWSDWGEIPHIERATMDGTGRYVLRRDSGRATGLTVDYNERRLYWINIDTKSIVSSDIEGKERLRTVVEALQEPFGLTQYQDFIYWTDATNKTIERANKTTGENRTKVEDKVEDVTDILVFHASRQSGWNPCSVSNGGCSNLCLAMPSSNGNPAYNHSCSCPTHHKLDVDNKTCNAPLSFMLMSQRNQIVRLVLDSEEAPDVILPIHHLKNVRSIDYDFIDKFVYWIDGRTDYSVRKAYENGSNLSVVVPNPSGAYLPHDFALDVYSRRLYWTCAKTNVINVTRLDTTSVGVVIGKSVSGSAERPRAIVLHSVKGWMFFVNMLKVPTIERAALDGMNRVILFSENLKRPNALALDLKNDMLYWSDEELKRVESADVHGGNRRQLLSTDPHQATSLAVFGNHLYWIDRENIVMRVNKLTGANQERVLGRGTHPIDIIAVDHTAQLDPNKHPCYVKNGGCSHLCMAETEANAEQRRKCSCPAGLALKSDDLMTCGDPPTCSESQFTCEKFSMECIPIVWRCDGTPECKDKSDEKNCPNCERNQYRCDNGKCIDVKYLCNGIKDCSDNSDESHCCKLEEFMCAKSHKCVQSSLVCNGHNDCPDGSDELHPACNPEVLPRSETDEPRPTSYTIGIVVSVVVLLLVLAIIYFCRRRTRPYGDGEGECADMMLATKSLTLSTCSAAVSPPGASGGGGHPPGASGAGGGTAPLLPRSSADGECPAGGATGQPLQVKLASNNLVYGHPYERSHVTGASSSSSGTHYPQETLNPPPSPVTDKSQCSGVGGAPYCCSAAAGVTSSGGSGGAHNHSHHHHHHHPSYRHYRTRNRPPPPTPCSTDVCEDSEPYLAYQYRSSSAAPTRYYADSRALEFSCYASDPYPPPPTPRSPYPSDDNCELGSYPPSPSTERSFFNPYPPPPSPEGPSDY